MSQPSPPPTPLKASHTRRRPASGGKEDFLLAVLECMEGSPKIDFEKLAQKMNYKSAAVANARFHQIKRAVIKASDAAAPASGSPPPSPAKKVEKVEKVKKEAVEANGVVKKRGRGRPKKVKVAPAAPSQPVGGEGGRGEKVFGEDFGAVPGEGEGVIDPRVLEVGTGDRMEEEEEEDTELEGEKGGRVGFGL